MNSDIVSLIIILICVMLSAYFSATETSFTSLNRIRMKNMAEKGDKRAELVLKLLENFDKLLSTILVGNNIALVIYSLQMSLLIQTLLSLTGWGLLSGGSFLLETVLSTIIIIFAAEYIPKAVVRLNPNLYYRTFAVPVFLFYLLFYPLARITTFISTLILRIFGLPVNTRRGAQTFDRIDLAHLIDEASEGDEQYDNEKDIRLFQNALDFSGLLVRDCMVPRVDIEAIDRTDSIRELTSRFIDTHFSRLPVYEENIDRIIGYVNTKSLFRQPATIDEILQQIDYVPESMPVQKLLTAFIKKRHSVAVVIDEFGGTAGMITIEDILEEIFGEIEDEHDDPGLVEKQMGDGEFIFSGRLEVEYINGKYHLDIPESDEYDTLAGYVIDRYQGIPSAGETILDGGRKIRVLRTESSKIELLRITLVGTSSQKSVQA
jgi:CBS domain containing-hemolysin-like protein